MYIDNLKLKTNQNPRSYEVRRRNKNKNYTMEDRKGKLKWNVLNICSVMKINIVDHIAQPHHRKKISLGR